MSVRKGFAGLTWPERRQTWVVGCILGVVISAVAVFGGSEESRMRSEFAQQLAVYQELGRQGDCRDVPAYYVLRWNGHSKRFAEAHEFGIELLDAGLMEAARRQLELLVQVKLELGLAAAECRESGLDP